MKRTIEKLSHQSEERQKSFEKRLEEFRLAAKTLPELKETRDALNILAHLKSRLDVDQNFRTKKTPSRGFLKQRTESLPGIQGEIFSGVIDTLATFGKQLERHIEQIGGLLSVLSDLVDLQSQLGDARDREWDALGSNHVGMIFKSLERRVDELTSRSEDASLLMKTYSRLREKTEALLVALDKQASLSRDTVEAVSRPLQDFTYAGFENRHRGSGEEVIRQQQAYLELFSPGRKVMDLGCGRGEFVSLLTKKGIEAEGIDLNTQMVEICLENHLNCRNADLLDALSEQKDGSLGGIFSSQVIEHLPPASLKRMIETAWIKLAPGAPIILETINPVSVFALVQTYFLDLTHQQPVPPAALRFLLESTGFDQVEIRYSAHLDKERLQDLPTTDETTRILNDNIDKLNQLLYAPTNFAAIGRKR